MLRSAAVGFGAPLALAGLIPSGPALAAPVPAQAELSATLDGVQVAPGPGDPDGGGTFRGTLISRTGELCYDLELHGIGALTGVRIHVGLRGRADLAVGQLMPPGPDGTVHACVKLKASDARDLVRMPVHFYVEATTEDFPRGAVRGQLTKPGIE